MNDHHILHFLYIILLLVTHLDGWLVLVPALLKRQKNNDTALLHFCTFHIRLAGSFITLLILPLLPN